MPILTEPVDIHYLTLPPQKARLSAKTDVLVVGGGPAGIGAAWGAAKAGAQVIVAERYGFLGGNATVALVMPFMSYYNQHRPPDHPKEKTSLLPYDHGRGKPVIGGVLEEFVDHLVEKGGAIHPSLKTGYVVPFDPEIFKWTASSMLDEAGVMMFFHAFMTSVIKEGDDLQVVFQTKSGPVVIQAKAVVDCTGDGDVAFQAGAGYQSGRHEDSLLQPMTLMFRMGNFDPERFLQYVDRHPEQWHGVYGLWDLIKQAEKDGILQLEREDILFFATPRKFEITVNSTRVIGVSGVNVWDLTKAEYKSRQQMHQIVSFFKKYVPGFADSYIVQSGTQVGVRETRRIEGLYTLTEDDVLSARKFPDVVARNAYPIDIHSPEGKGTTLKHLPNGKAYDIPLRCLIPKKVDGIVVAGRCISGTHEASSSYRIMPVSMATGQAAGVAAAMAAEKKTLIRNVSYKEVRKELLKQHAQLDEQ